MKYSITPITGVHIGTGETLTPLDYFIAKKGKKNVLVKFSSERIINKLVKNNDKNDKEAMKKLGIYSENKEISNIQDFFKNYFSGDMDYYCDITDEFKAKFDKIKENGFVENKGNILQMFRSGLNFNPVIPGSSIKGAIKTALLNTYLQELYTDTYNDFKDRLKAEDNLDENKRNYSPIEKDLQKELSDFSDSLLGSLSVSDCVFEIDNTQLVGGLIVKYIDGSKKEGVPFNAEVLKGTLMDGQARAKLNISINNKLINPELKEKVFDEIRERCNEFYLKEFKNEYEKLKNCLNRKSIEIIDKLHEQIIKATSKKIDKKQFVIRAGRWSQVEYVTFEKDFRRPNTKKWGTTRTLFEYKGEFDECIQYVPMGWCILTEKGELK